jgi:hypothetical protein
LNAIRQGEYNSIIQIYTILQELLELKEGLQEVTQSVITKGTTEAKGAEAFSKKDLPEEIIKQEL